MNVPHCGLANEVATGDQLRRGRPSSHELTVEAHEAVGFELLQGDYHRVFGMPAPSSTRNIVFVSGDKPDELCDLSGELISIS